MHSGADVLFVLTGADRADRAAAVQTEKDAVEQRGFARAVRAADQRYRPSGKRREIYMLGAGVGPEVGEGQAVEDHATDRP